MDARLVVTGGKANRKEIQLKLPLVIGRGGDAGLTVAHPTVSRKHCEIREVDGNLVVLDKGSRNGTFVDDRRVKGKAILKPGGTLTIGPLTFRAEYEQGLATGSATQIPVDTTLASAAQTDELPDVAEAGGDDDFDFGMFEEVGKQEKEGKAAKPAPAKSKEKKQAEPEQTVEFSKAQEDDLDFDLDFDEPPKAKAASKPPAAKAPPAKPPARPKKPADDDIDFDLDDLDDSPKPTAKASQPESKKTDEDDAFDFLSDAAPAAAAAGATLDHIEEEPAAEKEQEPAAEEEVEFDFLGGADEKPAEAEAAFPFEPATQEPAAEPDDEPDFASAGEADAAAEPEQAILPEQAAEHEQQEKVSFEEPAAAAEEAAFDFLGAEEAPASTARENAPVFDFDPAAGEQAASDEALASLDDAEPEPVAQGTAAAQDDDVLDFLGSAATDEPAAAPELAEAGAADSIDEGDAFDFLNGPQPAAKSSEPDEHVVDESAADEAAFDFGSKEAADEAASDEGEVEDAIDEFAAVTEDDELSDVADEAAVQEQAEPEQSAPEQAAPEQIVFENPVDEEAIDEEAIEEEPIAFEEPELAASAPSAAAEEAFDFLGDEQSAAAATDEPGEIAESPAESEFDKIEDVEESADDGMPSFEPTGKAPPPMPTLPPAQGKPEKEKGGWWPFGKKSKKPAAPAAGAAAAASFTPSSQKDTPSEGMFDFVEPMSEEEEEEEIQLIEHPGAPVNAAPPEPMDELDLDEVPASEAVEPEQAEELVDFAPSDEAAEPVEAAAAQADAESEADESMFDSLDEEQFDHGEEDTIDIKASDLQGKKKQEEPADEALDDFFRDLGMK